jgi:hypothetical protein
VQAHGHGEDVVWFAVAAEIPSDASDHWLIDNCSAELCPHRAVSPLHLCPQTWSTNLVHNLYPHALLETFTRNHVIQ